MINVYTCVTTTTVEIENILSLSDFPLVNPLLTPLQETSDLLSVTIDKTVFSKVHEYGIFRVWLLALRSSSEVLTCFCMYRKFCPLCACLTSWRHNLNITLLPHFKCTVQWISVSFPSCTPTPINLFLSVFIASNKIPLTYLLLFPIVLLTPGKH